MRWTIPSLPEGRNRTYSVRVRAGGRTGATIPTHGTAVAGNAALKLATRDVQIGAARQAAPPAVTG